MTPIVPSFREWQMGRALARKEKDPGQFYRVSARWAERDIQVFRKMGDAFKHLSTNANRAAFQLKRFADLINQKKEDA